MGPITETIVKKKVLPNLRFCSNKDYYFKYYYYFSNNMLKHTSGSNENSFFCNSKKIIIFSRIVICNKLNYKWKTKNYIICSMTYITDFLCSKKAEIITYKIKLYG